MEGDSLELSDKNSFARNSTRALFLSLIIATAMLVMFASVLLFWPNEFSDTSVSVGSHDLDQIYFIDSNGMQDSVVGHVYNVKKVDDLEYIYFSQRMIPFEFTTTCNRQGNKFNINVSVIVLQRKKFLRMFDSSEIAIAKKHKLGYSEALKSKNEFSRTKPKLFDLNDCTRVPELF